MTACKTCRKKDINGLNIEKPEMTMVLVHSTLCSTGGTSGIQHTTNNSRPIPRPSNTRMVCANSVEPPSLPPVGQFPGPVVSFQPTLSFGPSFTTRQALSESLLLSSRLVNPTTSRSLTRVSVRLIDGFEATNLGKEKTGAGSAIHYRSSCLLLGVYLPFY